MGHQQRGGGVDAPGCGAFLLRQPYPAGVLDHGRRGDVPHARGYDETWRKLSARARRAQPFCTDCGTVEALTADHSAEAWARRARGQVIRVEDVTVLCGPCNTRRGSSRPGTDRADTHRGYPPPTPNRTAGQATSRLQTGFSGTSGDLSEGLSWADAAIALPEHEKEHRNIGHADEKPGRLRLHVARTLRQIVPQDFVTQSPVVGNVGREQRDGLASRVPVIVRHEDRVS